jgi:hypothetical protein
LRDGDKMFCVPLTFNGIRRKVQTRSTKEVKFTPFPEGVWRVQVSFYVLLNPTIISLFLLLCFHLFFEIGEVIIIE